MVGLLLAALSLEDLAPSTIVPCVPISFHLAQHLRPGTTQRSEADPEHPPGYAQQHVPNPCPLPFWGKTGRRASGRALRGCLEPYAPRSQPQSRRRPPQRPQPRPLPHRRREQEQDRPRARLPPARPGPSRPCPALPPGRPRPQPLTRQLQRPGQHRGHGGERSEQAPPAASCSLLRHAGECSSAEGLCQARPGLTQTRALRPCGVLRGLIQPSALSRGQRAARISAARTACWAQMRAKLHSSSQVVSARASPLSCSWYKHVPTFLGTVWLGEGLFCHLVLFCNIYFFFNYCTNDHPGIFQNSPPSSPQPKASS